MEPSAIHRRPARITDTYLGYLRGTTLTAWLLVDFGGLVRGIGGAYLASNDDEANRQYGEEFVLAVMRACGAHRWQEIEGRDIYVLLDGEAPRANVIGIENLEGEPGARFLFGDLTAPSQQ